MVSVIMTFRDTPSTTRVFPSIVIPVGVCGITNNISMQIEYVPSKGMRVAGVFGNGGADGFVETPLGLVRQANACFKKIYGDSHNTPVLHLKSFRVRNDNVRAYHDPVKEYDIQDLSRLPELLGYYANMGGADTVGSAVPVSCMVLNSDVCFYNICANRVNSPVGLDVSHGDEAFRKSMIARGFHLIP